LAKVVKALLLVVAGIDIIVKERKQVNVEIVRKEIRMQLVYQKRKQLS
jgi:hypothetical protein